MLIRPGSSVAFFHTDPDGQIRRRPARELAPSRLQQLFCRDNAPGAQNDSSTWAVTRGTAGSERLLSRQRCWQLLQVLVETGEGAVPEPEVELPACMQLYVPPALDRR